MVYKLVIDTCVWLDLAKNHNQLALLTALEALVELGQVRLVVPRIVVDEFKRNKVRVAEEGRQSLAASIRRARDAVNKFGDGKQKKVALRQLNEIDHKLPSMGEGVLGSIERIEKLFNAAELVEATDDIRLRAANRAIDGRAPFHRQRNSINDAIIFEIYREALAAARKGERLAFVTHNVKDFSAQNLNNRLPHPDIVDSFSRIKSRYFIELEAVLRLIDPELLGDMKFEEEWTEEPRKRSEIIDAIDLLFDQVWYNRHWNSRIEIERGKIKLVDKETFPVKDHSKRPIQKDVWEAALKAAARVENKRGLKNLGPWTDFEWGMINGKLSALRWVLGDDWDMLDT